MTEKPVDAKIIKKTQDTLGKVITNPTLTEKYLNRPPFKYLHHIVKSVIESTGFMKGLFTEDELISDNVNTKESKFIFLQKVMDMISLVTGKTISAKPSKIIAGQEAEKTNEFLQMLADACSKKIDNNDYVRRVLSTDDYIIPKKSKKIKDDDEIDEKPKKIKEPSKDNEKENKDKYKNKDKPKEKKEKSEKSIEKSEKSKSKEPEKKQKIRDENRDENRGDKKHEKSPEKSKDKIKEKSKESDKEKVKDNDKKKESKSKEKENKERDESREKKLVKKASRDDENQDDEKEEPVLKSKSKAKKLDDINEDYNKEKPRKITRPNSSKPAPKVKLTEPGDDSAALNGLNRPAVIIDHEDNSDDDMFIAADAEEVALITNNPPKKLEDEEEGEHGGLVKKILETKKDLEASTQNKKTEIERQGGVLDASKRKEREAMQKDIERLRASIQALTRGVNPLGKVLDFLQEDFDSMQREIKTWSDENKKNITELIREQSLTESSIVPLKGQLRDLDLSIRDQLEQIAAVKNNILNNDKKLNNLLISITKT